MYEVETKFGEGGMGLKEKIRSFARIHGVSEELISKEYADLADTQMSELRKWQYINSLIYKMKGAI